jgi:hypothetical protein
MDSIASQAILKVRQHIDQGTLRATGSERVDNKDNALRGRAHLTAIIHLLATHPREGTKKACSSRRATAELPPLLALTTRAHCAVNRSRTRDTMKSTPTPMQKPNASIAKSIHLACRPATQI